MERFVYYNPVKWIFGKGALNQLKAEITAFGRNVLVIYGGGSIKKSGLYSQVMVELSEADLSVAELSGVEPNPRLDTVRRGVEICKRENIEIILAVGGGSVIDCAKAVAAGAKYNGDVWDIITKKVAVEEALSIGTVLTIAATGSEMNSGSVITNLETNEKRGWGSPYVYPAFSICDPTYTFTVPKNHTVYGMVDMMTHILESYFHHSTNTVLQDRLCESALLTVMETAPKLLENPESYEHRETIMYTGTIALNGMLQMGYRGDWATHNIEHAVSAVYDIPHAGGLAILFPNWMKYTISSNPGRFKQLAVNVFGVDSQGKTDMEAGLEGIKRLREFWSSLGAPERLADYKIDETRFDEMVEKTLVNGPFGNFQQLDGEDVRAILKSSL